MTSQLDALAKPQLGIFILLKTCGRTTYSLHVSQDKIKQKQTRSYNLSRFFLKNARCSQTPRFPFHKRVRWSDEDLMTLKQEPMDGWLILHCTRMITSTISRRKKPPVEMSLFMNMVLEGIHTFDEVV